MSTNAKSVFFTQVAFLVFICYNFLCENYFLIVEDCKNTHTLGNKYNSSYFDTNINYLNALQAHTVTPKTVF